MALNMVNLTAASPASPSSTGSASNTADSNNGDSFGSALDNSIGSRNAANTASGDTSTSMKPLAQAVKQQAQDEASGSQGKKSLLPGAQGEERVRGHALLTQLMQQSSRQGGMQQVQADALPGQADSEESSATLALSAMLGDKSAMAKLLSSDTSGRSTVKGDRNQDDADGKHTDVGDTKDSAALVGALMTPLSAQPTVTAARNGDKGASVTIDARGGAAARDVLKSRAASPGAEHAKHTAETADITAKDGLSAFAKVQRDAAQGDGKTLAAATPSTGDASTSLPAATMNATTQPSTTLTPSTPASPTPAFTATLDAPVGSDPWNQSLGQQMMRLSHVGNGEAELHLNPPDLGQLQVSLKMGENQAQMHFASPHAHVRAAVEAALPQLRDAFADNGISLGQTSVSDQGNGQAFSFNQQPSSSGSANGGGYSEGVGDDTVAPVTVVPLTGPSLKSGIDIFA